MKNKERDESAFMVVNIPDRKFCLCGHHLNEFIELAKSFQYSGFTLEPTLEVDPTCNRCKELKNRD